MTVVPDEIGFCLPLVVAVAITLVTIAIHALAFWPLFTMCCGNRSSVTLGVWFLGDVAIVAVATLIMLVAHLVEIAVWAMSPTWRLLAPLEATDGMLMFGLSTAMLFAIAQRPVSARLFDSEPDS